VTLRLSVDLIRTGAPPVRLVDLPVGERALRAREFNALFGDTQKGSMPLRMAVPIRE
jgi:hypothetical protein